MKKNLTNCLLLFLCMPAIVFSMDQISITSVSPLKEIEFLSQITFPNEETCRLQYNPENHKITLAFYKNYDFIRAYQYSQSDMKFTVPAISMVPIGIAAIPNALLIAYNAAVKQKKDSLLFMKFNLETLALSSIKFTTKGKSMHLLTVKSDEKNSLFIKLLEKYKDTQTQTNNYIESRVEINSNFTLNLTSYQMLSTYSKQRETNHCPDYRFGEFTS